MLSRIILLSLLVAVFTSCFKMKDIEPKPDLPPLTTEGKNTFGCYINGVPWKHGTPGLNLGGPTLEPRFFRHGTSWGDSIMGIRAWKHYYQDKISRDLLSIGFRALDTGIHEIKFGKETFKRSFTEYQIYSPCIYNIDTTKVHVVNLVRFDLQERIASGTFEMTLYNTITCNDTLVITEGRFDVRFLIE